MRAALRSLQGEFSQRIHALVETLIELRSYVEASIDFVDEEIDFLSDGKVAERLRTLLEQISAVQQSAQQGRLLRDGMTVVIAGRPNAGKSSLLNRLAGYEAAIVTEIPGTTRDVLREHIHIDGMPVHIIDTAGLHDSPDIVEQEGMRRTWDAIAQADRVLLMIDDRLGIRPEDVAILTQLPAELPVTVVRNKIDLTGHPVGEHEGAEGPEVVPLGKERRGHRSAARTPEDMHGLHRRRQQRLPRPPPSPRRPVACPRPSRQRPTATAARAAQRTARRGTPPRAAGARGDHR